MNREIKCRDRIKAIKYFVKWGIPEMWKQKQIFIRAAWLAARLCVIFDGRKNND